MYYQYIEDRKKNCKLLLSSRSIKWTEYKLGLRLTENIRKKPNQRNLFFNHLFLHLKKGTPDASQLMCSLNNFTGKPRVSFMYTVRKARSKFGTSVVNNQDKNILIFPAEFKLIFDSVVLCQT